MYSKVTILGHLGGDPELKYTTTGSAVCTFSIASNHSWKAKDGSVKKKTVWYRVTTWNQTAELCNQILKSGARVFVEGELNANDKGSPIVYQRKDGTWGASYEVTARFVRFIDRTDQPSESEDGGVDPIMDDGVPF